MRKIDTNEYERAIQETVKPKFKGKKTVKSRVTPRYPKSAEREYTRFADEISKDFDRVQFPF